MSYSPYDIKTTHGEYDFDNPNNYSTPLPLTYEISTFQKNILQLPEDLNLFLGGGRGGAKTVSMALLAVLHCLKYGKEAKVVYFRERQKSTKHFESCINDILDCMPRKVVNPLDPDLTIDVFSHNTKEHEFKFFNRSSISCRPLYDQKDYSKSHGQSYSLVIVDELGEYAEEKIISFIDSFASCLRGDKSVPRRLVYGANPGGQGHHLVYKRYVAKVPVWKRFKVAGGIDVSHLGELFDEDENADRYWMSCPSTFMDNPFINRATYLADLINANQGDLDLVKAWVAGDWTMNRGAYFTDQILDPSLFGRNKIAPWPKPKDDATGSYWRKRWKWGVGFDWGSTSPSVALLYAVSPGADGPDGLYYPKGSVVLVDEYVNNKPGSKDKAIENQSNAELGEAVVAFCEDWGIPPEGPADDKIFHKDKSKEGSIAAQLEVSGLKLYKAGKQQGGGRIGGWIRMKQLLFDASRVNNFGQVIEKPGMYITTSCKYWWLTIPYLVHDPKKDGDVLECSTDHAADTTRYIVVSEGRSVEAKVKNKLMWGY